MPHSYASNRIHLIFSTKGRERRIPEMVQQKLWPYMAGIARNHGFQAMKVGGVEDHVHALLLLPPSIPLAKAVQILKSCSSKWLNDTNAAGANFSWQEGYGAFSVSASHTEGVLTTLRIRQRTMRRETLKTNIWNSWRSMTSRMIRPMHWDKAGRPFGTSGASPSLPSALALGLAGTSPSGT